MNQDSVGLPNPHWGAFFYRGAPAVYFFFTLSGFLITYLLLEERRRTGNVNVSGFYLRRACRIWPLYFLIVGFGLTFYNFLLPRLGIPYRVEYSLPGALGLYTLMLPHVMSSLYTVGGILNPLWSIGVEEQFYLTWAPVLRRWAGALPRICGIVLAVSLGVAWLNELNAFGEHETKKLIGQLKFHFMAAGALAAWWLHRDRDRLLRLPPFASRPVQLVLLAVLLEHYVLGLVPWGALIEVMQLALYAWLIVTVAANPRNAVPVENRLFERLGAISYGLYLFHMPAVYLTSMLFKSTDWWRDSMGLYLAGYYGLALSLTVLLAHLSYRYFELPFLRYKDRRFSPPTPVPAGLASSGGAV